eukprot:3824475-Rhodomonas_salina.3
MQFQAQTQGHEAGQTYRVEQDNFDSLHCLRVEDIPAFQTYDGPRPTFAGKSAFSSFAGAQQKDIVIAEHAERKIPPRRDSLEGYDPLMWMQNKDREIESDTHDQDEATATPSFQS